ncbi:MAG: 1,4-dihydroxy-2-naphthoyl-CoA hydrolase [Planctomycetota bacterium]|jgi:1,4-dihydroxy-2-naphthoyl-CoA hydrolase
MIWKKEFTVEELNQPGENYNNPFELDFLEKGADYLICKMPVNKNTRQPMGLLHGGASVYMAETIGSMAGHLCVARENSFVVGLDINANHLRGVREGFVYAKAMPIHIGGKTHVWSIEITNEEKKMVCICRLTLAVINA